MPITGFSYEGFYDNPNLAAEDVLMGEHMDFGDHETDNGGSRQRHAEVVR